MPLHVASWFAQTDTDREQGDLVSMAPPFLISTLVYQTLIYQKSKSYIGVSKGAFRN
jgi:hypothetical protein